MHDFPLHVTMRIPCMDCIYVRVTFFFAASECYVHKKFLGLGLSLSKHFGHRLRLSFCCYCQVRERVEKRMGRGPLRWTSERSSELPLCFGYSSYVPRSGSLPSSCFQPKTWKPTLPVSCLIQSSPHRGITTNGVNPAVGTYPVFVAVFCHFCRSQLTSPPQEPPAKFPL